MTQSFLSYLPSFSDRKQFLLASIPLLALLLLSRRRPQRQKIIPPSEERVLVLGASSGVGREIALRYAERGAYVFLVARSEEVERATEEALSIHPFGNSGSRVISEVADFSSPNDLLRVRERIDKGAVSCSS